MPTYDYYINDYLGSEIGEKEFSPLAKRAQAVLEKLCRDYKVVGGEDARAMAVCAMAETLKRAEKSERIASASLGGVSVRYAQGDSRQLLLQLYRRAAIYLDIYRGRYYDESH